MDWLKNHKRVLLIAFAVVFLFALFLLKNRSVFQNEAERGGLAYDGTETVGDLIKKDTDGDGVFDWQEGVFGTDPLRKETTPGTPDAVHIQNAKRQSVFGGELILSPEENEKLTETEKLSRELFSSLTALNQAGEINDTTIDTLSSELVQKLQNPAQRKVFEMADIQVSEDNSVQAVKKYYEQLSAIYAENSTSYTVLDVMHKFLQKFITDEESAHKDMRAELDPLINETNKNIARMRNMRVPASLASLHLDLINILQKLTENMEDIKQYENDIVIAMGGLAQYEANMTALESVAQNLAGAIGQKLKI